MSSSYVTANSDQAPQTMAAIFEAVMSSDEDAAQRLLERDKQSLRAMTMEGNTPLHVAIQHGHMAMVRQLVLKGADLEIRSRDGSAPIYLASALGFVDAVEFLLRYHADVEAWNAATGLTALHVAVTGEHKTTIQVLLEYGANRWKRDSHGHSALERAQANDEVLTILQSESLLQGPSVVSEDPRDASLPRFDSCFAFPEDLSQTDACKRLKATIVDFYLDRAEQRIQMSASIQDLLYGDGPEAIMTRAWPQRMNGLKPAFRWYHLPANNMQWVTALVKRHLAGSDEGARWLSDDFMTSLGLCRPRDQSVFAFMKSMCQASKAHPDDRFGKSKSSHVAAFIPFLNYETQSGFQAMSEVILRVTKARHLHLASRPDLPSRAAESVLTGQSTAAPRSVEGVRMTDEIGETPSFDHQEALNEVHQFDGNAANQTVSNGWPVTGRVGSSGTVGAEPHNLSGDATSDYTSANSRLERSIQSSLQSESIMHIDRRPSKNRQQSLSPTVRSQESSETRTCESGGRTSADMIRTRSFHTARETTSTRISPPQNPKESLIQGYLFCKNLEPGPLQLRRTLDQYHYAHLDTTKHRDKDQVVLRYTSKTNSQPKLFMVDQMWLWVLNGDTVISCFPSRWNSSTDQRDPKFLMSLSHIDGDLHINGDVLDPYHTLIRYLGLFTRKPMTSAFELAKILSSCCANIFDDSILPEDLDFFEFFDRAIRDVVSEALERIHRDLDTLTNRYQRDEVAQILHDFHARATGIPSVNKAKEQEVPNIAKETGLLIEIEDIRDEIGMLRAVIKDQRGLLRKMNSIMADNIEEIEGSTERKGEFTEDFPVLERHLVKIEKMEEMASETSNLLQFLVDLKQKQASIFEAHYARKQLEKEAEQAQDTARQSQTTVVFTVITIVFLPLSFMAAFFAININAFPVDENGQLGLDYVLRYMLGVSAGLSVPFILVVFNQEKVARGLGLLRIVILRIPVLVWEVLIAAIIAMVVTWTTPLTWGLKLVLTIVTVVATVAFISYYSLRVFLTSSSFTSREEPPVWLVVVKIKKAIKERVEAWN